MIDARDDGHWALGELLAYEFRGRGDFVDGRHDSGLKQVASIIYSSSKVVKNLDTCGSDGHINQSIAPSTAKRVSNDDTNGDS